LLYSSDGEAAEGEYGDVVLLSEAVADGGGGLGAGGWGEKRDSKQCEQGYAYGRAEKHWGIIRGRWVGGEWESAMEQFGAG